MECKSIICVKHGPLIGLHQHANNIARFLIYGNLSESDNVGSWFRIASGITKVHYISDRFDNSFFMCGTAMEYEDEKSKFHSKLIHALTFFNYVWGGFEAYVDTLELNNCPSRRGKINKVNFHLKENFSMLKVPIYYNQLINELKALISKNPWYGNPNELFELNNCLHEELTGLNIVYKIRNMFAHGAFEFSEPDGWNDIKPYDVEIITGSSRIVLFTMQILLMSNTKSLNFKVPQFHEDEEFGELADKFIINLHLKNYKHS
jgi:hypothetical protein